MFPTFRRSRLLRVTLALLAFVAIGYASAAMTAPACERSTSRWLDGRLARHPKSGMYPYASSEPGEFRLPWIVAVNYEFVGGNTGGEWGTRYYVGLLGLPILIRDRIREMS